MKFTNENIISSGTMLLAIGDTFSVKVNINNMDSTVHFSFIDTETAYNNSVNMKHYADIRPPEADLYFDFQLNQILVKENASMRLDYEFGTALRDDIEHKIMLRIVCNDLDKEIIVFNYLIFLMPVNEEIKVEK